jgi:hypothetical protein
MSTIVENASFVAEFPGTTTVTERHPEPWMRTTVFESEAEPFGLFTVKVAEISLDAFVAVGPRAWVAQFGDHLMSQFADRSAEVMDDRTETPLGGAIRDIVLRIDYEGPCGVFAKVFSGPDGHVGRVVVASAVVDWSPSWNALARSFLDSVKVKWSAVTTTLPASGLPE